MNSTATAKIHTADNGYFQTWERPCGHTVRVTTEYDQQARRNAARRRQMDAATAARLSAAPCRKCSDA